MPQLLVAIKVATKHTKNASIGVAPQYKVNPPPQGNFLAYAEFVVEVKKPAGNSPPQPMTGLTAGAFAIKAGPQNSPAPLFSSVEVQPGLYRMVCGLTFAFSTTTPTAFTITVTSGAWTGTTSTTLL